MGTAVAYVHRFYVREAVQDYEIPVRGTLYLLSMLSL